MRAKFLIGTATAVFALALAPHAGFAAATMDDVMKRLDAMEKRDAEIEKNNARLAKENAELRERMKHIGRKEVVIREVAPVAGQRNAAAQPMPQAGGLPYGGAAAPSLPGVGIAPLAGGAPLTGATAIQSEIRGLPVAGAPSLYINGVSITPGGFIELTGLYRSHFIGADIGTPFQNIPFGNVRSGYANEFRFTARQSRPSLLVKGDVNPTTHISGFLDLDFEGAAQTANLNESNSFTPRIRNLYAAIDQDDFGAHLLAGQTWSLATMNSQGIMPRQENIPLQIDAQYVPGFVWTRNPQIRVVKDFDQTLWFALSAENPATTFGGFTTAGTTPATLPDSLVNTVVPVGGSLFNSGNAISLNHVPDIIGKVAWDPSFEDRHIHMEAFGLMRDFYSQVNGQNQDVFGGGVGGSILVPIIPKTLEFQFSGLTGRGIGRYGAGQLSDVTFNWNGTIAPLKETMLLTGLVYHASPELDIYGYAGQEDEQASFSDTTTGRTVNAFGYGNPLFSNAGCTTPGSTVCNGNVHLIRQLTAGFWDKIYQGPFGSFRTGLQYSFTEKYGFNGIGGAPKATENIVMGSLRFYPF